MHPRKFYAMREARTNGYMAAYPSQYSSPYMIMFSSKDVAEQAQRRIEWLAENKKITHSNARVFQNVRAGASQCAPVSKHSSLRFVVGRPPPDEIYWIGEQDRKRLISLESFTEDDMLDLTIQRRIGVAIVGELSWTDARGMTYSCIVVDPERNGTIHPWILECLMFDV